MSSSVYAYSAVTAAVLLGGCYYYYNYWWGNKEEKNKLLDKKVSKEVQDEKAPLLDRATASSKDKELSSKAKNLIARFETLEARNKPNTPEKAPVKTPPTTPTSTQRCPVCRKKLAPEQPTTEFQELQIHHKCFSCRECNAPLHDIIPQAIHRYTSNGKVQFLCLSCQEPSSKQVILSKLAGERVEIQSHEQGDTKQVLQDIGDDLEQAVYFMTPRCTVCGGTEFDRNSSNANPYAKGESPSRVVVLGRTIYHSLCFDTGRPETIPKVPKLPPSFCAKYLPQQIILKLVMKKPSDNADGVMEKKKKKQRGRQGRTNENRTLTTLYFVWKDRETQASLLRQEEKDASSVTVPFSLDEQAPANPNHCLPEGEGAKKRKRPVKTIRIPNDNLRELLVIDLLTPGGAEVAPRCPIMPEPSDVVPEEQEVPDLVQEEGNEDKAIPLETDPNDAAASVPGMKATSCLLTSKLSYLKFGLEYILTMTIPCTSASVEAASGDGDSDTMPEPLSFLQLNVEGARLFVTIQDDG